MELIMEIIKADENIKISEPSAVALGFFDGVHLGHIEVITAAKNYGLKTVVVSFEQHPDEVLKDKTVLRLMTNEQKEQALEDLGVDVLIYLNFLKIKELSPEKFIVDILKKQLNARAVFCGFNYKFGKDATAGIQELEQFGRHYDFKVKRLPPVNNNNIPVSSTCIRVLIEKGEIEKANILLGRPFSINFEVIHGRKLGRSLGTPTINQSFPLWLIKPRFGVYATTAIIAGKHLPAVTNVGTKPTVASHGSDKVLAETYIPNFNEDLYGKTITVEFIRFIRDEMKFDNIEELKTQIFKDIEKALEFV
jgi:riboflavin kinase/FMN adenylyltransferase